MMTDNTRAQYLLAGMLGELANDTMEANDLLGYAQEEGYEGAAAKWAQIEQIADASMSVAKKAQLLGDTKLLRETAHKIGEASVTIRKLYRAYAKLHGLEDFLACVA